MSKRAERRHHVHRIAAARRNDVSWHWSPFDLTARSDSELATRHPLDCGRRCFLCHYDKLILSGQRRQLLKRETNAAILEEC